MLKYVYLYFALVPVFFFIDYFWINYVAKPLYMKHLGDLIEFNLPATAVFYLMYIAGIILFGVQAGVNSGQWQQALIWGGLFGFFTYATYDMTNLATLKDWSLIVSIYDIAWGTILGATVSVIGYHISKFINV